MYTPNVVSIEVSWKINSYELKAGYSRFCASDLLITNVDHIVQILHS